MNTLALPELPSQSGTYRWLYTDVVCGDVTAVFIFMVGSLFSARYSASLSRGGRPQEYCAVNFALYRGGVRRQWVLSEYGGAQVEDGGRTLRIGNSVLRYGEVGGLSIEVNERTAPWGRPAEARLELWPRSGKLAELPLDKQGVHYWQPLAPRAEARLVLPRENFEAVGHGYHDTNHGAEPLGRSVKSWRWARVHRPEATYVHYHVPDEELGQIRVKVAERKVMVLRGGATEAVPEFSTWGLKVPREVRVGEAVLPSGRLLESAPFYARFEGHQDGAHVLGEVADFRRFHSPFIRWMAHFRTRVEAAA